MKMIGKNSPDFACGQVLYSIKMSELDYLVKETPYSIYVTIRKKFVKGHTDADDTSEKVDIIDVTTEMLKKKLQIAEKENKGLKEKIADDLQITEMLRVEYEELEMKTDNLESDKSELEDTIEELYREISQLKQKENTFVEIKEENMILKDNLKNLDAEIGDLKSKYDEVKSNVDFKDIDAKRKIDELEDTIQEYLNEIKRLKELNIMQCNKFEEVVNIDEEEPSTSKCGNCDYKGEDECDMKVHKDSNIKCNICGIIFCGEVDIKNHNEKAHKTNLEETESTSSGSTSTLKLGDECQTCHVIFATTEKLKKHLCRITIRNPSFCDMYIKHWIAVNNCNLIYHRIKKIEIAIIHCQNCIKTNQGVVKDFQPSGSQRKRTESMVCGIWTEQNS